MRIRQQSAYPNISRELMLGEKEGSWEFKRQKTFVDLVMVPAWHCPSNDSDDYEKMMSHEYFLIVGKAKIGNLARGCHRTRNK